MEIYFLYFLFLTNLFNVLAGTTPSLLRSHNVKKILWPWIKPMIRVTDCTSCTHRRNTANHPKPPQTTPNHRKPPKPLFFLLYMITLEKGGNGCDIATIRSPLAFRSTSVYVEGGGKKYRRTKGT